MKKSGLRWLIVGEESWVGSGLVQARRHHKHPSFTLDPDTEYIVHKGELVGLMLGPVRASRHQL